MNNGMRMHNATRRLVAGLLVGSLTLAACSSGSAPADNIGADGSASPATAAVASTDGTGPIVEETLELTFSGAKAPLAGDYEEMALLETMEAQTNVDITWENLPEDVWAEQKSLILASGDLPDGIWKTNFTDAEISQYGSSGALIPLEDLIAEHAPNIQQVFERRPSLKAAVTAPDGHIYTLPASEELGIAAVPFFWSINQTWLDELGLEMPTTVEEYRDVLVAFRDQDPNGNGEADEIPLSFINNWWCADEGDLYAALAGMPDNPDHRIVRDDQVIFTATQPEYRDATAELHEWYAEGLIDQEAYTQDDKTYLAKGKTEDPRLGSYVWWETTEVVGEERTDDYVLMEPLEGPSGRLVGRSNLGDYARNAFAITSANPDPVATIKWVDRVFDPFIAAQFSWGPEGDVFEQAADGTLTWLEAPEGTTMGEYRQKVAPGGPTVILKEDFGTVVEADPRALQRVEDLEDHYLPYIEEENYPQVFFTQEELDQIATIEADVLALVNQKQAEWIVNGGIDAEWEGYLSQLEQMGVDRLVEIYQTGLDRYRSQT